MYVRATRFLVEKVQATNIDWFYSLIMIINTSKVLKLYEWDIKNELGLNAQTPMNWSMKMSLCYDKDSLTKY